MGEPAATEPRLILGTQTSGDAEAALPLLHAYLNWRRSRLVALFSGQIASHYSFSARHRLITVSGRMVPPPAPDVARRAARRDSLTFQKFMTALAEQKSLPCEFIEAEGDMVATVCQTATPADVAILAQRSISARAGPVILIAGEKPDGPRAFAEALAKNLSTDVLRLQGWSAQAAPVLLGQIERLPAGVVVVDSSDRELSRRDLQLILSAARCPVILFGATQTAA